MRVFDNLTIQNVNDCKGTPIINYKHEFKNGLLKLARPEITVGTLNSQRQAIVNNVGTRQQFLAEGVNHLSHSEFNNSSVSFPDNGNVADVENAFDDPNFLYEFTIEKSYWAQNQIAQHQTPDWAPLVHFGCMPVPSNFALAATETYAAAVVQWQVECELMVECNLNNIQPNDIVRYIKSYDPIYRKAETSPNINWGRGIYICNRKLGSRAVA